MELDLERLLRAGAMPTTYLTPDGTLVMLNDVGARNLGRDVSELVGRSIYTLLPDMADTLRPRIEMVCQTGSVQHYEDDVTLPDGKVCVFDSVLTPIFDDDGRVGFVQAQSLDVTARREAERGLAESERRYRLAMEAVRDGIWDWNVATGDFELSPAFLAMLGYSEDEIEAGRQDWFFGVLHPDDVARVQGEIEAHFRGETEEYVTRYRWQHKDGSWRWALSRGRMVERAPDGSPIRMLGTTTDVTEQHALEARLLAAEKMEAIGRLAGGVAHDFNNLLTAVMGHVSFLESYDLQQAARDDLTQISAAVSQASRLVGQLLSFARRRLVQPTAVSVNPLLSNLEQLLSGLIGANIDLTIDLSPDLPFVHIDPAQLEQIVINLALNARDAMPDGGKLSIATAVADVSSDPELAAGSYVRIEVADTGSGMDEATQQHVFEPFFTTKGAAGTGMGLASCYGIVKQAGGDIAVSSEPDVGTTFVVHLPVHQASAAVEAAPDGALVLVVEDEGAVRRMLSIALERGGFRVLQAESGEAALELLENRPGELDALVTDMMMPGMTGVELAQRLTRQFPELPVVFVSGYAYDVLAGAGSLPPDATFLAKPFAPQALVAKVRELLGQAGASPRMARTAS